jgi:hypothetical protein
LTRRRGERKGKGDREEGRESKGTREIERNKRVREGKTKRGNETRIKTG